MNLLKNTLGQPGAGSSRSSQSAWQSGLRQLFCWALFGDGATSFVQEGIFFSKAAMVTFGGAYSVLAYLAQQAVHHYGWIKPEEMLDGLGLAETTPGSLISPSL